ncbi:uncharacterized protein LOC143182085 [Calliopsis andreniformis]|uniref:uncharacterized protein LOC143182085 n=1 Tax=Calliopsis andreniformis TaxID=337506 RepID=UPI003FCDBC16
MARNGRKCYLCGRKQQANASYALHKFPKDTKMLEEWKMFCKFRVEDDASRIMICSLHFKKEDIVRWDAKQLGGRMALKAGAIPCIFKPVKEIHGVAKHILQTVDTEMDNAERRIEFVNVKQEPNLERDNDVNLTGESVECTNPKVSTFSIEDTEVGDDHRIEFVEVKQEPDLECDNDTNLTIEDIKVDNVEENTEFVNVEEKTNLEHDNDTNLSVEGTEVDNVDERTEFINIEKEIKLACDHDAETNASIIPKRRKYAEPRYVGDLTSSHIQSPQCAQRTIRMIQEKFNKKSLQLKLAQQQIRRLKNRLNKLEDLVTDLKKQNVSAKDTTTALTEGLPTSLKELLLRNMNEAKKQKFSPVLRSFAVTLSFYSPKAYDYVRSVWKNILPHPDTIKKW